MWAIASSAVAARPLRQPASGRPLRFSPRQRGEPPGLEALRVEHEAGAVDHRRHPERQRRPVAPAQQRGERAPDLPEAEQHHLHPLGPDHRAAGDAGELEAPRGSGAAPPPPPRASTTTEMLSSDEPWAMATTLIPPAARAENTPAATPGVPCMPRPTTATVAMPGLTSTPSISPPLDLLAELAHQALAGIVRDRLGHAEADRVLRRRLGDERDRDLPRVQRGEGTGGDAGHAEHAVAGHRDQRLAAGGGERLHRERARRHPLGDLGARRVGSAKGRTKTGMRRPATGISARGWSTLAP